ncbi:MAG: acyltransferase [Nitrospirales bacterium]|nr:MAG: acyltransferase [Nitrospirales bacterium]
MLSSGREHIQTLTGLRGVAAIWVVLLHVCFGEPDGYLPGFYEKIQWGLGRNIILQGVYAVDIFFVLSGFILTYVHRHEFESRLTLHGVGNFLSLRLARIYPMYLVVAGVLLGAAIFGVWDQKEITYGDILRNVTLTNIWVNPSLNTPAWSVSAEWLAYLCFPIIIKLLIPIRRRDFQLLIIFFLVTVYPMSILSFQWKWEWHYGWVAVARVLNGFILGCMMFCIQKHFDIFTDSLRASRWCLAAVLVFLVFLVLGLPIVFLYPLIPFIIVTLANTQTGIAQVFGNKVVVFLGTISFGIYMVHYPVLEIIRYALNDYYSGVNSDLYQPLLWVHLCGILLLVIAMASLCYVWIENPSREYLKRKIGDRKTQSHQFLTQRVNG